MTVASDKNRVYDDFNAIISLIIPKTIDHKTVCVRSQLVDFPPHVGIFRLEVSLRIVTPLNRGDEEVNSYISIPANMEIDSPEYKKVMMMDAMYMLRDTLCILISRYNEYYILTVGEKELIKNLVGRNRNE